MVLALEIVFVLLLIIVNGLFSMSELALVSARRARLAVLERKGVAGAALARRLAEDPQLFLPTVQVGITLVAVLTGVFGGARIAVHVEEWLAGFPMLAPVAEPLSLALVVVVTTYLTMVLGELVPKHLALRRPELTAAWVAPAISWTARISAPVVWLLDSSSGAVLRLFGLHRSPKQTVTEEELKALLAEGAQAGVLETEERDMIERVLRLADKPVRAIMTPRTEIAWIDRTDPPREIALTLKSAPHSRFVVCDGSVDNVVGVVQAKDILDRILDGSELSVAAALRQPIIVPDTVTALDALERLKSDTLGLALVMDEYGSFEGVVTAADVLEAIVGDLPEAGRSEQPAITDNPEGGLIVDGLVAIEDFKIRLGLQALPGEDEVTTVGGFILTALGRLPKVGDTVTYADYVFEVQSMTGRRVDKLTVKGGPVPLAEDEGG